MLIFYGEKHPGVYDKANLILSEVISNPKFFLSNAYSLGELIVLLSVSNYKWEDIESILVPQMFKQIKDELIQKTAVHTTIRQITTAEIMVREFRNIMFNLFFLRNIARPNGKSPKDVLDQYNYSFGRPSLYQIEKLNDFAKKVVRNDSLHDFLTATGYTGNRTEIEKTVNDLMHLRRAY